MSHTPGRAEAIEWVCHAKTTMAVTDANGNRVIVADTSDFGRLADECAEDTRRLVACWNACDGLATESLEQSKPMAQLLIDHAMLTTALEMITNLLRGDGRFPATVAQLDITLAKHGRSA